VLLTVGLIVLFRERLNRQGRLSRAASDNSYAAYVIHAPVLVVLALLIRDIHLYPLLKFALVTLIAIPLCFAFAALIRRVPGVPARPIGLVRPISPMAASNSTDGTLEDC